MKFSVIVPVYGVEKYLDECVSSILSQTYADFELILVDDCSPDRCPAMCDGYALRDSRVRVLHKEKNEGLGFARNSGMELAQGEYILFADSDDTLSLDTLSAYAEEVADKPDVVACGLTFCHENKKGETVRREVVTPQAFYCDSPQGKADMLAMLTENRVFQYAWNKAYRREFLLSVGAKFEKTKLIEDFLFNIDVFSKANAIRALNAAYYFYRKPKHETLASKYNADFFALVKRRYTLAQAFLQEFDTENKHAELFRTDYIKHCISAVIRNRSKRANLSAKEQKQFVREMLDDPITVQTVQAFTPKGLVYKLVRRLFLKKRVRLTYLFCAVISKIKSF